MKFIEIQGTSGAIWHILAEEIAAIVDKIDYRTILLKGGSNTTTCSTILTVEEIKLLINPKTVVRKSTSH